MSDDELELYRRDGGDGLPPEVEVRGAHGTECNYEDCTQVSTTLVQFDETKPVQRIWFCGGHAGSQIANHDDAHKFEADINRTTGGQ